MTTKQQKIDAIYEKIANKELSFGCRLIVETTWLCHSCSSWYDNEYTWIVYEHCTFIWDFRDGKWISKSKEWDLINELEAIMHNDGSEEDKTEIDLFKYYSGISHGQECWERENTTYFHKIIWHPVMIGDVMEYFYGSVRFSEWAKYWKKLTKPIEEQSDECVDFVYNLIKE